MVVSVVLVAAATGKQIAKVNAATNTDNVVLVKIFDPVFITFRILTCNYFCRKGDGSGVFTGKCFAPIRCVKVSS